MRLDTLQETSYVARKICVYGPPKTGKTELVGALASHGYHLFWFDLDNGIKTLLRPDSRAKAGLANIELIKVPDTVTYPIGIQTLRKVTEGGSHKICFLHGAISCFKCAAEEKKGTPVDWVTVDISKMGPKDIIVIDSVSQLVSSTMSHITREQVQKGNDDYKPDWDDWRKQGYVLDRVFGAIQAGNFNVIGISHEEEQKLENGQKRLVPVGGTGNYSKTFAKYWDDVVYTDIVNGSFKAVSAPSAATNAIVGSRAGKQIGDKGLVELFV